MDLYEALKAGTEPDELERKFKEELAAAVKKFNDEEDLNDIREELAAEIIDYLALVLGKAFVKDLTVNDIVEVLKSMEKDIKASSLFLRNLDLDKNMKASSSLSIDKSDEDIINAFLKGLK
jgi:hypothetical protein